MQNIKKIANIQIKQFLINKFNEIGVDTKLDEWQHIKDYQIPNQNNWESKFFHQNLGYMDIKENNQILVFNIDTLAIFRYATQYDNIELIQILFNEVLKKSSNPNCGYYEDGEYNLTNAARYGQSKVIEFLVKNGVSIHVEDEVNVIAALLNEKYEVVQYFLETDPNINQEVIFKNNRVNENMINFIEKWNYYQELNKSIAQKPERENKVKLKI